MLSRREFLRNGGLGGVIALAVPNLLISPAAALVAVLSPVRKRTYSALIEALALLPGSPAEAGLAAKKAEALAGSFRTAPAAFREDLEVALDAVDDGVVPGAFAAMTPEERVDQLRMRLRGDGSRSRRNLERAVAFAISPFAKDARCDVLSAEVVQTLVVVDG